MMKILVVDDFPLIRIATRQVLQGLDAELEMMEASDCKSTKSVAEQHEDLDLILLDLRLPDTAGFECLEWLRLSHETVPVVVLSATDRADTVRQALELGAMGYIPKTYAPDAMIAALQVVLSKQVFLPKELLTNQSEWQIPEAPVRGAKSWEDLHITARERDVAELLVRGMPNKRISTNLDIAEATVRIHVSNVLRKLGVARRAEAVARIFLLGLKLRPDFLPAKACVR
jgi:DNA-binding NarL/FixJ family response regulator